MSMSALSVRNTTEGTVPSAFLMHDPVLVVLLSYSVPQSYSCPTELHALDPASCMFPNDGLMVFPQPNPSSVMCSLSLPSPTPSSLTKKLLQGFQSAEFFLLLFV